MRLLRADTDDLILETVDDESRKYAILSHKWLSEQEEVTYADLVKGTSHSVLQAKEGWKKLEWCKQQAVRDGHRYIWADTVCIDKSNNQELNESVNSMYRWYEQAECCYVYLHDMPDRVDLNERAIEKPGALSSALEGWSYSAFRGCAWFTRAWTLQEMIAPATVRFYDKSWTFIGHLHDLVHEVASITGVHIELLMKQRPLATFSIAQKMSWASGRSATKVEDRVYSLLGIMGVTMSVLYSERERAFQRLQDELLRGSFDDSIFAFPTASRVIDIEGSQATSLLADSLEAFRGCGNVSLASRVGEKNSFQMASKEFNLHMRIFTDKSRSDPKLEESSHRPDKKEESIRRRRAILDCGIEGNPSRLMTLSLFNLPSRPNVFYVDAASSRARVVSLYEDGHNSAFYEDFSVVKDPDKTTKPSNMQEKTIFCNCKVKDSTLRFINATLPCTWLPQDTAFTFQSWDSKLYATLEVWTDLTCTTTLRIEYKKGGLKVDFGSGRVNLPQWTTWTQGGDSYQSSVTWNQGRFLVAKAFPNKTLFGHLPVCLVEIYHVGLIHFALSAVLRLLGFLLCWLVIGFMASTVILPVGLGYFLYYITTMPRRCGITTKRR